MDASTCGLILRTHPLTETSLIVNWLTRDFGRISTVAKGARRPKSPFAGKLDLFFLAELSFRQSQRSELHALRELRVLDFHQALRAELGYLQQAAYLAQLVEKTTEVNTPLPGLFELVKETLSQLPGSQPRALTVFAFEMKLLAMLGLAPDLADTRLSAGTREVLTRLPEADWAMISRIQLSAVQQNEVERFLHGFLIYHLGGIPRTRAAACHVNRA